MSGEARRTGRMAPVTMLARARLRSGRASLVVLALLVAITGATAITALTGAQRTVTAYERLRDATGDPDAAVTGAPQAQAVRRAADLPDVDASVSGSLWVARYLSITDRIVYVSMIGYERTTPGLADPLVVEGRLWDPSDPDEALVTERFAKRAGIEVGDQLRLRTLLPEQFQGWDQVNPVDARGGVVRLRVVGIMRDPFDAGATGSGLFVSPGFVRAATSRSSTPPVGTGTYVRLHDGEDGSGAFSSAVARLVDRYGDPGVGRPDEIQVALATDRDDVTSAARVAALGLVAFAAVAAFAGLVALTQALGREMTRRSQDNALWAALGLVGRERALALAGPTVLAVAAGTAAAIVLAIAASPLTPIGAARSFEPHEGVDVNVALLALGGAVWLLLVGALVAFAARRGARLLEPEAEPIAATTPSAVAAPVVRSNLPVPVTVGLRMAVEQRAGRRLHIARTPIVTAAVAITAVVAAVAFSASLIRLVSEPARYGWEGDGTIEVPADVREAGIQRIAASRDVEAATVVNSDQGRVEGERTTVYGLDPLRGSLGFTTLSGRAPAAADEVLIGPNLADDLGVSVGDAVDVGLGAGGRTESMRVVGLGLTIAANGEGYDRGALVTGDTFRRLDPGRHDAVVYFRLVDSVADAHATATRLAGDLELVDPQRPGPIAYLDQLRYLPRLLALLLGAVGVAAVAHGFVVGSRRWSYDLAVLRVFGFTRRQTAAAVGTMATATIVVGSLIGVPAGLIVARLAWSALASDVHVATDLARPVGTFALLLLAAVALANAVAAAGARTVRRSRAAVALRTE